MKRALLVAAATAAALVGTIAQAQSYRDRDGYRWDRREARREFRQDRREFRRDQREFRRDVRRWRRGEVLYAPYRAPRYVIRDYRRYRLAPPPRGYAYYHSGNDILLAALATGLITTVISDAFAPTYAPPVYAGYAYAPPSPPVYVAPPPPPPPPPAYAPPPPRYEQPYYPPRQDRN